VVIVDIKLPVVSGYEICKFINQSETLKKTRVYLMKGSFEPLNQDLSKDLRYEEIITKPFDSNQVVSAVMNILGAEGKPGVGGAVPEEAPVTVPEDFSSIETEIPGGEINFSDVREDFMTKRSVFDGRGKKTPVEDDVLPSEEITQGTQPPKEDLLAPETDESLENPFETETVPEFKTEIGLREPMVEEEKLTLLSGDDTSEAIEDLSLDVGKIKVDEGDELPGDFLKEEEESEISKRADESSGISHVITATADKLETEPIPFGDEGEFPGDEGFISGKVDEKEFFIAEELEQKAAITDTDADAKEKPPAADDLAALNKELISGKIEDKLTLAIKELLWDIIPPLAEKIIKEEIEKIKSDMNKPE
jgi:CheY-like chemotaxis protein